MNTSRINTILLGILTLAVITATALAAWLLVFRDTGPYAGVPEDVIGQQETTAKLYCTYQGVVPGMTGIDDPAYLNCVERMTKQFIQEWQNEQDDKE